MNEQTLHSLRLCAKMKMCEAGINFMPYDFERFWSKFVPNLCVALENEISMRKPKILEDKFVEVPFPYKAVTIAFAIGWAIGRLQGIF